MFMKRGLILIIFLLVIISVIADSDEITTTNIPAQSLTTGENKQVLDLNDYFNGTNLIYKYKEGSKGLNGTTITFDESLVDITSNLPGQYSVIFIADNDTDDKESNDVILNVAGNVIISQSLDFFPVGTSVTMEVGEKKNFAVSGENVTAEWYLNNLRLPETTGTFVYDAAIAGTNTLEVRVGTETNTWTIIVEAEEIIEAVPPPVVDQSICGNNKKESGENCQNCPQDVKCASGSSCVNAICIKDEGIGSVVIWFVAFGVVIVGLVGGLIIAKRKGLLSAISFDFITKLFKKKEKIEENSEENKNSIQNEEKPVEEDLSVLKNYLESNLKEGHSKEELIKASLQQGWTQEQIDKSFENNKPVETKDNLKPLSDYIKVNLKKGYNKEELVRAVLQQGWKKEEVDEVLAELENDYSERN